MMRDDLSAKLLEDESARSPTGANPARWSNPLGGSMASETELAYMETEDGDPSAGRNPYHSLHRGDRLPDVGEAPAAAGGNGGNAASGTATGGRRKEPAPWRWTVSGMIQYAHDRLTPKDYVFMCFVVVGLPALAGATYEWDTHSRELLLLVVTAMLMWLLAPFNIHSAWVALMLLFLIPSFGIESFNVTWEGGGRDATWIIFAGMVIAEVLKRTPLGDRIAYVLLHYSPSLPRLIFNSCCMGLLLAIMVPSSIVRATIMVQAAQNVLDQLDLPTNSPTHTSQALFFSLGLSTVNCGSGILTATAPNLLTNEGLAQQGYENFSYAVFAAQMFVPFSLVQIVSIFFSIWFVFGRNPSPDDYKERRKIALARTVRTDGHDPLTGVPLEDFDGSSSFTDNVEAQRGSGNHARGGALRRPKRKLHMPPLSIVEKKTLFIIFGMIILWVTDVANGIQTVIIALGGVVALTFPQIGPLRMADLKGLNFPTIIFVIGIIALGNVSARNAHLQDVVSRPLREFAAGANSKFAKLWMTSLTASIVMWLFGSAASASLATSVFVNNFTVVGLSPKEIALSIAAAMNVFFLPYQSAPLLVAKESKLYTTTQFFYVVGLNSLIVFFGVIPLSIALRNRFDDGY